MSEQEKREGQHIRGSKPWFLYAGWVACGGMAVLGLPLGVLVAGQGNLLLSIGIYLTMCMLIAVAVVTYGITEIAFDRGEAV